MIEVKAWQILVAILTALSPFIIRSISKLKAVEFTHLTRNKVGIRDNCIYTRINIRIKFVAPVGFYNPVANKVKVFLIAHYKENGQKIRYHDSYTPFAGHRWSITQPEADIHLLEVYLKNNRLENICFLLPHFDHITGEPIGDPEPVSIERALRNRMRQNAERSLRDIIENTELELVIFGKDIVTTRVFIPLKKLIHKFFNNNLEMLDDANVDVQKPIKIRELVRKRDYIKLLFFKWWLLLIILVVSVVVANLFYID